MIDVKALPKLSLRNIRKRADGKWAVRISRKTEDKQKALLLKEFLLGYLNNSVGIYESCSAKGNIVYNVQTFKELAAHRLEDAIKLRDYLEKELHMKIGM